MRDRALSSRCRHALELFAVSRCLDGSFGWNVYPRTGWHRAVGVSERLATLPATACSAGNPQQGPFQLSCSTLPFETIKKDRDIDDACDRAGTAGTEPQREQNRAKNEFCASGSAALATEFSFKRLQAAAEDAGVTRVPADRSVLKNLQPSR